MVKVRLKNLIRSVIQLAGNVCALCGAAIPVGQVMCTKCASK